MSIWKGVETIFDGMATIFDEMGSILGGGRRREPFSSSLERRLKRFSRLRDSEALSRDYRALRADFEKIQRDAGVTPWKKL